MDEDLLRGIIVVTLVLILLTVGPIFTILALNSLFNFQIEINFNHWLAAFWLGALVYGARTSKGKD